MATTYTLIDSEVLTSSQASVTFSAIPADYTDLVVKVSGRTNRANTLDLLEIVFNSDTSALYSYVRLWGDGSSASSSASSGNALYVGQGLDAANATANTFGSIEIYIPNYTSTTSKPISSNNAQETNASGATREVSASLYRNTSAISSMTLQSLTSNSFVSGSSFYLYGISNA